MEKKLWWKKLSSRKRLDVIPVKTGIHGYFSLDSRLRGNDRLEFLNGFD